MFFGMCQLRKDDEGFFAGGDHQIAAFTQRIREVRYSLPRGSGAQCGRVRPPDKEVAQRAVIGCALRSRRRSLRLQSPCEEVDHASTESLMDVPAYHARPV